MGQERTADRVAVRKAAPRTGRVATRRAASLDERLQVQAVAGNLAAREVLAAAGGHAVQARLRVGAVDDPLEHAADAAADAALRQLGDDRRAATGTVRRRASASAGAASGTGREGGALDAGTDAAIRQGGGRPLPDSVRARMERAFAADFSAVRIHADDRGDRLARGINAEAFTAGHQIFFRSGRFDPSSSGGERLLAHELAHVVQQGAARAGGPVRRSPVKVQRLFGIGEARSGRTDFDTEQLPSAFIELADSIQQTAKASDAKAAAEAAGGSFGYKDFGNIETATGGTGFKAFGTALTTLTGTKDMVEGEMSIMDGAVNLRSGNSIRRNLGAQQVEGGVTKMASGATSVGTDLAGSWFDVPFASAVNDGFQAVTKGKKAIEESAAAEKLRHERHRVKHDQDHLLPMHLRVARLEAFRVVYREYKDAEARKNQATTDLATANTKLKAELETLAGLEGEAGTAAKELKQAEGELKAAQSEVEKINRQQQAYDEQQAKKSANPPATKGIKGFFAKLRSLRDVKAPAAGALTAANTAVTDKQTARTAKQSASTTANDKVTAQKRVVETCRADVARHKQAQAKAAADMKKAKGKMKRGDLARFEETLMAKPWDTTQPCTGSSVKDFLDYCAEHRIKEFGKGTEFRKDPSASQQQGPGDEARHQAHAQMGHLGEFSTFARGRKIQQASFNSVEAAGHTLDAAGTFTAGADMGATKLTGKVIKTGSAVAKSGWTGFKRARRVHRLRKAKNEVAYGGKTNRGVLWGAKTFFFGNIEGSQKKVRTKIKAVGAGNKLDTRGSNKGVDLRTKTEDDLKRLRKSLTIKCVRQINAFLECLGSPNRAVRRRAHSIYKIIVETNLAGAIARVKESDLDAFGDLLAKHKAHRKDPSQPALTPAEQRELKKLRGAVKEALHMHLDGIGG